MGWSGRGSPGAGGWVVAVQDLCAVGAAGGCGAIRVEGDGPAPLVDGHMMVEEAVQGAAVHAGRAAVGQVPDVVDLAGRCGLVTAARLRSMHQYYAAETVCE